MIKSDRNLYLTADRSRVVEEDDIDQASLLVGGGCELDPMAAAQYGIEIDEDGRLVVKGCEAAEDKQIKRPEEDKQADAPENKAIIPPEKKRRKARRRR